MINTITFDLDDTLWPLKPTLKSAEVITYSWLSCHAPAMTALYSLEDLQQQRIDRLNQQPELHHQISQVRRETIYKALLDANYSEEKATQIEQQAFKIFLNERHNVELFEHSKHLLTELHKDYKLGVLTNGNADIYQLPIGKFFDFAFRAEELNASKPSKEPFLAAMKAANCKANQIIHIGDSIEHDVMGALNVGCHAIWFNPNYEAKPDNISKSYEVNCLRELPETIKKIQSA